MWTLVVHLLILLLAGPTSVDYLLMILLIGPANNDQTLPSSINGLISHYATGGPGQHLLPGLEEATSDDKSPVLVFILTVNND